MNWFDIERLGRLLKMNLNECLYFFCGSKGFEESEDRCCEHCHSNFIDNRKALKFIHNDLIDTKYGIVGFSSYCSNTLRKDPKILKELIETVLSKKEKVIENV